MKKYIVTILTGVMLFLVSSAYAKSGDMMGRYYSTDIKTYLNGVEIDAINIGGETLINAEVMHEYGFSVNWSQSDRTLKIHEKKSFEMGNFQFESVSKFSPGTPMGYYYETDIITYLDGTLITAYNTGGQTYIHAENMSSLGYLVKWYPKERQLDITSPVYGGYVYDIPLLSGKSQEKEGEGWLSVKYENDKVNFEGDGEYLSLHMYAQNTGYKFTMAFYQNEGLYYSSKLLETLKNLCYDGYGVDIPCKKEDKYELVNKAVTVSINGCLANKVSVTSGAGNGHRDFEFYIEDLPEFKMNEINEIIFTVKSVD